MAMGSLAPLANHSSNTYSPVCVVCAGDLACWSLVLESKSGSVWGWGGHQKLRLEFMQSILGAQNKVDRRLSVRL